MAVIQSVSFPDADLKMKHIAISFHAVREAVVSGIVALHYVNTHHNFSDVLTKLLPSTPSMQLTHDVFWHPPHKGVQRTPAMEVACRQFSA